MIRLRLKTNDISKAIKAIEKLGSSSGKRFVQRAAATSFMRIADTTFDGQNRPRPWPAKKGGAPATLQRTGALRKSIAIMSDSTDGCEVGSALPYSLAHFFGYNPRNLPARPYFPVISNGSTHELTPSANRQVKAAIRRAISYITRGVIQ